MVKHSSKCNPKTTDKNVFKTVYQNIKGLKNKHNELLCHLQGHASRVLTEHHLDCDEIPHLNLDNYTLGAFYCRRYFKMDGTCIYVQNNLNTININLHNFCCDKDIKACAISINNASFKTCILTIYR
jgi:hypothetical protein